LPQDKDLLPHRLNDSQSDPVREYESSVFDY
jgi:hypothetical protein